MLVDLNYALKLGVVREERDIQSPIQEVLTQLISLTPVFGMSFSEESRTDKNWWLRVLNGLGLTVSVLGREH